MSQNNKYRMNFGVVIVPESGKGLKFPPPLTGSKDFRVERIGDTVLVIKTEKTPEGELKRVMEVKDKGETEIHIPRRNNGSGR